MALNLPSSAFTKLNEAILLFNRTCTVVYPERRQKCENCVVNTMGGRSANFYRAGGPIPFNRGTNCPQIAAILDEYTVSCESHILLKLLTIKNNKKESVIENCSTMVMITEHGSVICYLLLLIVN